MSEAREEPQAHPRDPPWTPIERPSQQWRDAAGWLAIAFVGLVFTAVVVRLKAQLGTASAPFLGRFRLQIGPASLLAPAVATALLMAAARGWLERISWRAVLLCGYLAALGWALAL